MKIGKILKIFYRFILKRKGLFVWFLTIATVSNVLANLNPYFYRLFVEAIPSLDRNLLLKILALFISTRVAGVVFDLIDFYIGDMILITASKEARLLIFKHVQKLDFSFHSNKSTGGLISAFKRGDSAFFSFFHDIHHRLYSVIIGFFVMVFFLAKLNVWIVVLVSASLAITIIAARVLISNNVRKRRVFNIEEDKISGIITDNLINFETVKLFAKEKWEQTRLAQSFNPWIRGLWGYANSFRAIDATMGVIVNLSVFMVLYLCIQNVVNLKLTVGDFVLITGFVSGFYPKLWDLVWSTRDLAKNYADIQKYFGLLDYKVEVAEPVNPTIIKKVRGAIEFKNVSHSYAGGAKNAIKNLSLKITPGESIALVGRSGSGKTTFIKLLMRFFDPEKGKITIDGHNIKNIKKSDLRGFFGVVPQETSLFNDTIAFNIGYGDENYAGKKTTAKIISAAKLANIDEFIQNLPKKYLTNVGERGIKLSGGQKQRLAIARMILSDPDIIIFDEATSHLDSESEKLIQNAFWKVSKGKTTIVIAHRLSTVKKADRIIVMEKGRIMEIGKHEDLITKKDGIYSKFWKIQLES